MDFLIVLACTVAAVIVLRNPLKRLPWAFYALAVLCDVVAVLGTTNAWPVVAKTVAHVAIFKGGVGMALFVVVMFIGALPREGSAARWLHPVRAELSILASLFIAGHMAAYAGSYLPYLVAGAIPRSNVAAALVVALCLVVLLVPLFVTSFNGVKSRMKTKTWRKLQTAAYVFFALVFIHVALMLGPAAMQGGEAAVERVAVYGGIFVLYVAARAWRAVCDARAKSGAGEALSSQELAG